MDDVRLRWRQTDPERYRAYMREYMKQRRTKNAAPTTDKPTLTPDAVSTPEPPAPAPTQAPTPDPEPVAPPPPPDETPAEKMARLLAIGRAQARQEQADSPKADEPDLTPTMTRTRYREMSDDQRAAWALQQGLDPDTDSLGIQEAVRQLPA